MARIRSIKPETWQDEKLASVPIAARLLFIGLWSAADDEGRLRGHPAMVKAAVFPYDADITPELVGNWLMDLESIGAIQLYEAAGQSFVWVVNFNKHQRIDHASKSPLPAPPSAQKSSRKAREHSPKPREDSTKPRETLAPDQGAGSREQGEEQGREADGASAPSDPDLAVYLRWRELYAPRAAEALTDKRRKLIQARRAERPPARAQQDLLDSLGGWRFDPWAGRRDQVDLELLLRDAGHVDKGLALLPAFHGLDPPQQSTCVRHPDRPGLPGTVPLVCRECALQPVEARP